jgi:hypothetical protein
MSVSPGSVLVVGAAVVGAAVVGAAVVGAAVAGAAVVGAAVVGAAVLGTAEVAGSVVGALDESEPLQPTRPTAISGTAKRARDRREDMRPP